MINTLWEEVHDEMQKCVEIINSMKESLEKGNLHIVFMQFGRLIEIHSHAKHLLEVMPGKEALIDELEGILPCSDWTNGNIHKILKAKDVLNMIIQLD